MAIPSMFPFSWYFSRYQGMGAPTDPPGRITPQPFMPGAEPPPLYTPPAASTYVDPSYSAPQPPVRTSPVPEGTSRRDWLNQMSPEEQAAALENPAAQPNAWQSAASGLIPPVAPWMRLLGFSDNEITGAQQNFFSSPYGPAFHSMKTLEPLGLLGKAVQSAYKPDYTLGDAIRGVRNDAGFIEDIVTDPTTYAGMGLGARIGLRGARAGTREAAAHAAAPQRYDLPDIDLQEALQHQHSPDFQSAVQRGNQWLRDWFNHPASKARQQELATMRDDQVAQELSQRPVGERILDAFDRMMGKEVLGTRNSWRRTQNSVDQGSYYAKPASKEQIEYAHNKGEGWHGVYRARNPRANTPITEGDAWVFPNKVDSPERYESLMSTGIHEATHDLYSPLITYNLDGKIVDAAQAIDRSGFDEGTKRRLWFLHKSPPPTELSKYLQNQYGMADIADLDERATWITRDYEDYLRQPNEIPPRIMQARRHMNLEPGEHASRDDFRHFVRQTLQGQTPLAHSAFLALHPERFRELMNWLPATAAATTASIGLSNRTQR